MQLDQGLAALVLFADFTANLEAEGKMVQFMLNDPAVIIGLSRWNGSISFAALAMEAVEQLHLSSRRS